MPSKVLVAGPVSTLTGYGNDLCGMATSFVNTGWDVHMYPTSLAVPISPLIANLLTKEPAPPYELVIVHTDPSQLHVSPGLKNAGKLIVGWTMWEWLSLDNMEPELRETIPERLKDFDAIVTYDPVSKQAMDPVTPKGMPTFVQQGGYEPDDWKYVNRDWQSTFRYCMVAQMNPRKNPFIVIEAFSELKQEHGDAFNAELHLKTLTQYFHPSMEQAYPGLKIHYAYYPLPQMRHFYSDKHVLISSSHGEGKNMPALEAMSTGMVSLCTSFGGHTVWQHPSYSLGIDYVEGEIFGARAAIPSKDDLKAKMWWLYTHREEARQMGYVASQAIPQQCSWTNVLSRLLDKLRAEGLTI